jgi:hypothetical protein
MILSEEMRRWLWSQCDTEGLDYDINLAVQPFRKTFGISDDQGQALITQWLNS